MTPLAALAMDEERRQPGNENDCSDESDEHQKICEKAEAKLASRNPEHSGRDDGCGQD
jgi:hypothetical protein